MDMTEWCQKLEMRSSTVQCSTLMPTSMTMMLQSSHTIQQSMVNMAGGGWRSLGVVSRRSTSFTDLARRIPKMTLSHEIWWTRRSRVTWECSLDAAVFDIPQLLETPPVSADTQCDFHKEQMLDLALNSRSTTWVTVGYHMIPGSKEDSCSSCSVCCGGYGALLCWC